MKRARALLFLLGCAVALAEPQLTLEGSWPRLRSLHEPLAGGLTPPRWGQEFYIEEIEVPTDTAFSMTYVLPPAGHRFFIRTPPLPYLEDLTPFTPFTPDDHDRDAPWKR